MTHYQYFWWVTCPLLLIRTNLFSSSWMVCIGIIRVCYLDIYFLTGPKLLWYDPCCILCGPIWSSEDHPMWCRYLYVRWRFEGCQINLKGHPFSLGGTLQTGAKNIDMMLAGRFLGGIGVCRSINFSCSSQLHSYLVQKGIMSDLAPLYQAWSYVLCWSIMPS